MSSLSKKGWRVDFGEGFALPKPLPAVQGWRVDFGQGFALPKPLPVEQGSRLDFGGLRPPQAPPRGAWSARPAPALWLDLWPCYNSPEASPAPASSALSKQGKRPAHRRAG
jgi:hypothetical protein